MDVKDVRGHYCVADFKDYNAFLAQTHKEYLTDNTPKRYQHVKL